MADNELAKEIMSSFTSKNYCEYVTYLTNRDTVSITTFSSTSIGKLYWIDLRRCFKDNKLDPSHVLEIFCDYSGFTTDELRERIIRIMRLKNEVRFWSHAGSVVTQMNFVTYDEWLDMMENPNTFVDELMLYALSRIHSRHTVVMTANRIWTTVKQESDLTIDELMSVCDIRLVYLGNKTFGELRRLPVNAPPLPLAPSLPILANPTSKGKGKGKRSVKPLDLSKASLMKSSRPKGRPKNNSYVVELFETVDKRNSERCSDSSNLLVHDLNQDPVPHTSKEDPCFNHSNNLPTTDNIQVNEGTSSNSSNIVLPDPNLVTLGPDTLNITDVIAEGITEGDCLNSSSDVPMNNQSFTKTESNRFHDELAKEPTKEPPLSLQQLVLRTGHPNVPLSLEMTTKKFIVSKYPTMNIDIEIQTLKNRQAVPPTTPLQKTVTMVPPNEDGNNMNQDQFMGYLTLTRKVKIVLDKSVEDQRISDYQASKNNDETDSDGVYFSKIGGHVLRRRQRNYLSVRNRRSPTRYRFYRDMCSSPSDKEKSRKTKIKPPKSPSDSRIESQKEIKKRKTEDVNKKLTRSYPLFRMCKKEKITPENSSTDGEFSAPEHDNNSDVKPIEELKQDRKTDDSVLEPEPVPKGKFIVSKTIGVRKGKKKVESSRMYKCINCKKSFPSVALMNKHFKETHISLNCKICQKLFNTPNALTRHMYIHKNPKFKCDYCPKRFAFESDRDTHHIKHRNIKSFVCGNAKCDKSFFFEGDLVKHAKVHDKKKWKCKFCPYWNRDERNLKAHQRVHSNLKPYSCTKCLTLFRFHTQLKRHLSDPKKCSTLTKNIARSKSPEF